jgi:ribosomal protein S18 acetylase RimI-like enzyme
MWRSLPRRLPEAAFGQHQRDGIATTHVLVDDATPTRILGYCSLAAAQLSLAELQPEDRKRLPRYPAPAVRVGRLAVATSAQHRGIGRLLLGHGVLCALGLLEQLGVRVLVVDALNEGAAAFYRSYGFRPTGPDGAILYLPLGNS